MDLTKEDLAEHARIEAMFGDRTSFTNALPEPERVRALAFIDSTDDPAEQEERRMWMANVHAMAKAFKMTPKDVAARYEPLTLAYTTQRFGKPMQLTTAELNGKIKEGIQKRRDLATTLDGLVDKLTEDYLDERKPDFDRAMTKRLAEMDPDGTKLDNDSRAILRDAAARRWFKLSESELLTRDAIAASVDYFRKGRDASFTGLSNEQRRAVEALAGLDEEDQQFAISRAASLAKLNAEEAGGDKPGWLSKTWKATGRGISDFARGAVAAAVEAGVDAVRLNPAVQGEAAKTGGKVPTAQEVYARMEKEGLGGISPRLMDIERRLASALAGKADITKGDNWASNAIMQAIAGAPRMGAAINPLGMAVNVAAYANETAGELRDRGVPEEWARGLGYAGAPLMAAIDYVQAGIALKGWVPGGKTLVQKFTNQLAKGAATAGIQFSEQFSQEMAQDAVAPALQMLASELDSTIPAVDVMEEWDRLKAAAPETAGVMLVYTLLGTGRARWNDAKAERQYLANKEFILASGYSEQVAEQVVEMAQEATTAEDNEAIKDVLRDNLPNRDLTTPMAQKAQAQIAEQAQAVDLSHQPKEDGTPAADNALEPRWRDDGTIELVDAGGTVVAEASSDFEAVEIIQRYQGKHWSQQPSTAKWWETTDNAALPPTEPPTVPPQGEPTPAPKPPRPSMRLVQESIAEFRSEFPEMGLEELPAPDREKVSGWVERAVQQNSKGRTRVDDAEAIATSVLIRPHTLDKVEQAALVIRTAKVRKAYKDALSDVAASANNPKALAEAQKRRAAAVESYDLLTRAANLGGTEWGRAGAARRWTAVDLETFDLVSIVERIEAEKGKGKIAPEVLAELKKDTDEHKAVNEEMDKIAAKQRKEADEQAEDDVKTFVAEARAGNRPASKKRKDKKKKSREELIEELKKLGFDPVNGGELTPAVADIVAKLGEIQVEEGAKTLADIEGRMKQDVPALSNDEIHRAFAGKIAEEAEPKKKVEARIAEFKKQAGLWADIHAILESGELEQKGDKPVSSEKVQQLREILAQLRLGLMKTEMDDAKFEAAQKKLTEIQDQLAIGVRSIPDRKAKPEQSEAVKKVEAEINRLEKVMSVEDSIFDLEAKLQRKGPPTEKRRVEEDDQLFMLHRKRLELRRRLARLEESERPLTVWRGISATAEFMRASKATADFSSMFRQAVVLAPMRPVKFTKAAAKAMKAFFDSEYSDRLDFEMRRQPQHIWRERAGLFLSNVDAKMTGREEAFTSSWAERMPVFGAVVRGSNRHMVTMLNQMRVQSFDAFREANPDANAEVMNAMARYVNVATGRGDLRQLEPVAGFLAKLAFSPRFVASRIQMLGSPLYFAAKYKDKRVAKVAAKDMLAFTAAGMSILTLANLAGVEVGLDPEDSFFGKMRFGKVVIDLWGGLQQPVALLSKAIVKGGDRAGIVEANKDINVLDAGIRFLTYKANPGISGTYGIAFGEDIIGREVGLTEALLKSVAPMTLETAYEAWQESEGDLAATLATTAASASGVGVQVYEDKKKRKAKLRKVD